MRNTLKLGSMVLVGLLTLLTRPLLPACGQTAPAGAPSAEQRLGPVIREIDDSATGDRWLLVRNATNPAGPGRMVRVAAGKSNSAGGVAGGPTRKGQQGPGAAPERPAIHAGDAVIVEEHTPVVDARLEAVALGSAVVGAQFKARLTIGGKVVRAVAREARRAEMMPEREAQP